MTRSKSRISIFSRLISILFCKGARDRASRKPRSPKLGSPGRQRADVSLPLDWLLSLDPSQLSTRRAFKSALIQILPEKSLREAASVSKLRPPAPSTDCSGGLGNPDYQQLMFEWTIICRGVRQLGAVVIEEERLQSSLQEWMTMVRQADPADSGRCRYQLRDAYRRSVLILDSIQRRDITSLKRSVLRFNHLRHQLRI